MVTYPFYVGISTKFFGSPLLLLCQKCGVCNTPVLNAGTVLIHSTLEMAQNKYLPPKTAQLILGHFLWAGRLGRWPIGPMVWPNGPITIQCLTMM